MPAVDLLFTALAAMEERGGDEARALIHAWNHAAAAVCAHLSATALSEHSVAQRLMDVELAVGLAETCTALCRMDRILDQNARAH